MSKSTSSTSVHRDYFIILFGIAWWAALREKNRELRLLPFASRDVAWFAVGASLLPRHRQRAPGRLAGHGAGAVSGRPLRVARLLDPAAAGGWLSVSYYLKAASTRCPSSWRSVQLGSRTYFTWVSVIGYLLTKISVTLYAGGVVISRSHVVEFYTAAIVLIVVTGCIPSSAAARRGLTEVLQAIVLILAHYADGDRLSRVAGSPDRSESAGWDSSRLESRASHPDFP